MKEEWRDVVGYEGLYQVSNYGRVRSIERTILRNPKIGRGVPRTYKAAMKPLIENHTGYYKVNLCKNGHHKQLLVHQLVARAFIPNPNNYKYVNHLDCNRKNNMVSNLEWCTQQMNSAHAKRMGRYVEGIKIIEERYNRQLPLIVSTNLTGEEIRATYGERTIDRIKEMAVGIKYKGESFRK